MGTRVAREVPTAEDVGKQAVPAAAAVRTKGLLAVTQDYAELNYHPRTKETKQVFDYLAGLVHGLMGSDVAHDVTLAAADEVLSALKVEDLKDLDRKQAVEGVIGPISSDQLMQLVNLGKRITDFPVAGGPAPAAGHDEDEEAGVAVVFDEDEEEQEIFRLAREEDSSADEGTLPFDLVQEDAAPLLEDDAPFMMDGSGAGIDVDLTAEPAVDLEALAFAQGGHTMTNKRCVVPEGSTKATKAGYEEIRIPAPSPRALEPGERLVAIGALPEWARAAFAGYETLNRIQSRVFPKAFGSDENLLMCAPTGAGKTNVALLAMLHEIGKHWREGQLDLGAFKIVYVAPMKALVQEMVASFGRRLAPFGMTVSELTGDAQLTKAQLASTQVIVTTPEKWDVITRKGDDQSHVQLVRLVIFDEIHLLHDERGPVLEALVARTLRQSEATQAWVRLVGLSATLPNYGDVGRFLRCDKSAVFFFDASYRPCPLAQEFIGVMEKNALRRMELMNQICYEKVAERAGKMQLIVFVHSRKDTFKTAKAIRDQAIEQGTIHTMTPKGSREVLAQAQVKSAELGELLSYGLAIHHAGMTRPDRAVVEELFAAGHIQVLVSTATLAWGVNLPAHTVIIKGTQVYRPELGRWAELSAQDTLQMLGRAGRPQYDTQGEGIVITTHGELQFYLSLLNTQLPIESQLLGKLLDHLSAEVVLGSIGSIGDAVDWLGYTYLAVRMVRDPVAYGLEAGGDQRRRRLEMAHAAATALARASLIQYDRRSGHIRPTEFGRIASHYYVTHHSMATYNEQLRPHMDDLDLFRVFSLSHEFRLIPVRQEERAELAKLSERVPIPVASAPDSPAVKINVLLQAYISQLALEGFALASDMVYVTQSASRIMRAIFELCLRRGWARLAKKALGLCKMVDQRQWLSMTPLRQIRNGALPVDLLRRLENKDFPFERLADLNPQELGELVRAPKLGRALHQQIRAFPRLQTQVTAVPLARDLLRIDLTITPDFDWSPGVHGQAESFWILVEDVDESRVLHAEPFVLRARWASDEHYVTLTVPLSDPVPPVYFVTVVSDRWLGCESRQPVMLFNMALPERAPATTELPQEATELVASVLGGIPGMAEYYAGRGVVQLNAIQSQVLPAVFKSDENVLVAAPPGSGHVLVAELAIGRALAMSPAAKCVFMCPHADVLARLQGQWRKLFGGLIPEGREVTLLAGETTADLRALDRGSIVLATPGNWDLISRRWKTRKNVQAVSLFVVDDLHCLGNEASIETSVSRMRYVSAFLESQERPKIRIVALSAPIRSTRDVAAWLGVPPAAQFGYHPRDRPVRVDVEVRGFGVQHHPSALLAMARQAYKAVTGPTIVFVEDRRQARETAAQLLAFASAAGLREASRTNMDYRPLWPHPSPEDVAAVKGDALLAELVGSGIGFVSPGSEHNGFVRAQFAKGCLQVLVVAKASVHELAVTAPRVIILGTRSFLGREHRYVDYPVAEIVAMIGAAGQPGVDHTASVVLCCPSQRKAFYEQIIGEPLPIESALDQGLTEQFNAEIVVGTVRSKQDAIDYLTWSYLYRRLAQNPVYYGLAERSSRHLSEHMSQLVELAVDELSVSKCLEVEADGMALTPLNLGIIAAFYNVSHLTVEMFAMSLTAGTKLRGVLEIVAAASEFDALPIRHHELGDLEAIYERCPIKQPSAVKWNDPHVKALVLLQAHFSRMALPVDLENDQRVVVRRAVVLVQAIVDVISSHGWLGPALAAMEFSQMLVQAQWDYDSPLKQLPFFSAGVLQHAQELQIETVFDLIDDPEKRTRLLEAVPAAQKSRIAEAVNKYPNMEVDLELSAEQAAPGEQVSLTASIRRDNAATVAIVAPFYPEAKDEAWWLVVGNPSERSLLGIKRVLPKPNVPVLTVGVDFVAPESVGSASLKVYLISDCWVGCDQEFDAAINIQ